MRLNILTCNQEMYMQNKIDFIVIKQESTYEHDLGFDVLICVCKPLSHYFNYMVCVI